MEHCTDILFYCIVTTQHGDIKIEHYEGPVDVIIIIPDCSDTMEQSHITIANCDGKMEHCEYTLF